MALLSVAEAQSLVLSSTIKAKTPSRRLAGYYALGSVLAEKIISDIDSPPFDKAMVDGYAIRSDDVAEGKVTFKVTQEILAGQLSTQIVNRGEAASIMTGAPMPPGADAVVMHEQTLIDEASKSITLQHPVKCQQNIMPLGAEMKRGDIVLQPGAMLRPQEIGLLASVASLGVMHYHAPQVAILSTGDEVVEPEEPLDPGKIRNTNASLLISLIRRARACHNYLGIARDNLESLQPLVQQGLEADLLLISGGVSAGKVDLVPEVLLAAGVTPIFHKVALKPGKPLFFGTRGKTLVFGLPGNPVSCLVGFELFIKPALRKLMGRPEPYVTPSMKAELTEDFAHKSDRPTYYPVKLQYIDGQWRATPVPWKGSGDLRSLCQADTFAVFSAGEVRYAAGTLIDVLFPDLYS